MSPTQSNVCMIHAIKMLFMLQSRAKYVYMEIAILRKILSISVNVYINNGIMCHAQLKYTT